MALIIIFLEILKPAQKSKFNADKIKLNGT